MEQNEKEERDHLMQETLKRDLEAKKEASVWTTKAEAKVEVETSKVGDIAEREQDLILLQEKVQILKMQHNRDLRYLQKENKELKDAMQGFQEELMDKSSRIQDVEVGMVQMESIFKDLIDYRPPSRIYLVFLKNKWCHLRLKMIKDHKPYKLDTPKDFLEMCQEDSTQESDLLCKIYIRNFSIPHPY